MRRQHLANIVTVSVISAALTMAHILSSVAGAVIDLQPVRRALLSVSDKTDLIEIATVLASLNVELLSTGGTAKAIRDAGFKVIDVSDYTGSPEILVSILD
jgi:phosphoribosylaminoimidazolecarboxamide formyltransferase / IMP cyclohydrolase